ncbi:MAG: threonine/serine dehydratase [Candidatus Heimdallarchaeota archaeon]|nr:threonine/serine dehydratase [Candidatus Heimdallarchaeota archaeon]
MHSDELRSGVEEAYDRIQSHIFRTPLKFSNWLSKKGTSVYLKLENLQHTGSFKLRGALSKLTSLSEVELQKGIITASTGNHGLDTAYSLDKLKLKGSIFLPENVIKSKLVKLKKFTSDLEFHGQDGVQTEAKAKQTSQENNIPYISPYNDLQVIYGQGTIGIEIREQLKDIDYVFVTVGGGGLISGIGGYLKSLNHDITIVGCQPLNSPVMYESIKAGEIVDIKSTETISDGSAGGIEKGSITFGLVKSFVDKFVLVTEEEIEKSIVDLLQEDNVLAEGAAGVAVASFLRFCSDNQISGNIVIIVCGGNIGLNKVKQLISVYGNN